MDTFYIIVSLSPMSAARDSSANESQICAERLKALSDPTRLAVLRQLASQPASVTDLIDIFEIAQNLMSHHLRVLREAEFVVGRRSGKSIVYHLAEGVLGSNGKVLNLGCCQLAFKSK